MRYLLDTDTCIDLLRGVPEVVGHLQSLAPDDCAVSAITSFEIFAGAAKARNPRQEIEKIDLLLSVVKELPFAAETAREAGRLRVRLEKAGTPIGAYDLLIAAQALQAELILVSANEAEFQQVPDLHLENWR